MNNESVSFTHSLSYLVLARKLINFQFLIRKRLIQGFDCVPPKALAVAQVFEIKKFTFRKSSSLISVYIITKLKNIRCWCGFVIRTSLTMDFFASKAAELSGNPY